MKIQYFVRSHWISDTEYVQGKYVCFKHAHEETHKYPDVYIESQICERVICDECEK